MIVSEMHRHGEFLFRHRSYVPMFLLIPIAVALLQMSPEGQRSPSDDWWAYACFGVSLCGLFVRAMTVGFVPGGTSGRNTSNQRATVLNVAGLYSVVRHPLYVGNFLMWLGIMLSVSDVIIVALYILAFWLYYERIMSAEELYLADKFGRDYSEWAERTPAFVPRLSQWQSAPLRFSLKTVLRREYCGILGLTVAYGGLNLARHSVVDGQIFIDAVWQIVLASGTIAFFVLRFLKKWTRMLDVDGR
ncbi:MAG: isoprenylcysteine carboxylmethyltransferase family protein [Planctomycetaceae bacterium]